jgi:hypothetical protein
MLNRMTPHGNYEWPFSDSAGQARRMRLVTEEPDRWAVFSAPPAGSELDPARTVITASEPEMWTERWRAQWGEWAAPSPQSFLAVRDHRRYPNAPDWWIGRSHAQLRDDPPPNKTRTLAACVSTKYWDPGHIKRLDFLHFLDRQDLDLDIYGSPENGFARFISPTPHQDKSMALLPYRYSFDAENHATPNLLTEKIIDCVLAETLSFYWGAPNLDSFIDPRAFIPLALDDFEADLELIRRAIADDEWSKRLPVIRAEKQRVLAHLHALPALARAIDPSRDRPLQVAAGSAPATPPWFAERRGGCFVEIGDREPGDGPGPTREAERGLRWSGICIHASAEREALERDSRDCIVARNDGAEPIDALLSRNGVNPVAIDWLALDVSDPGGWLRPGGRLDPALVRANVITLNRASGPALERANAILIEHGYESSVDEPATLLRRGRDDVFGLYHLCAIGPWREIAGEQLAAWTSSGLLERTTEVHVAVIGEEFEAARALLAEALGEKLVVVHEGTDAGCFERPVLEHATRFFEESEPLVQAAWYCHGKGVSPQHAGSETVADWRRYMEHFLVGGWRECLATLEENDICGVDWREQPTRHFSGNFWWARPRYLASLPKRIDAEPHAAEAWIGTNRPRAAALHESGVDHYLEPYPRERYAD